MSGDKVCLKRSEFTYEHREPVLRSSVPLRIYKSGLFQFSPKLFCSPKEALDVASDIGVNFKNVGVLSIESSLFHLFHYTFLQTKHQRKCY